MLYTIIGGGSVVAILVLGGLCYCWCYKGSSSKGGIFQEFSFDSLLGSPVDPLAPSKDEQMVRESKYSISSNI